MSEWSRVDEELKRLRDMLPSRVGKKATQLVLQNLVRMRELSGGDPLAVLSAVLSVKDAYQQRPAIGSPFPIAASIAIAEAAARKLPMLSHRVRYHKAPRGLDAAEAEGIGQHADALIPAFGADDAELCASIAIKNILTFGRHLIWGQPHNRNDPTPVHALYGEGASYLEQHGAVPIGLLPRLGMLLAIGPGLPSGLGQRWVPHSLVFRGGGEVLQLSLEADLVRFFALWAPPITPANLAVIIHALLAPFSWDAAVVLDQPELIEQFSGPEAELEAERFRGHSASTLLGLPASGSPISAPELSLTIQPSGARIRYAEGRVTFG